MTEKRPIFAIQYLEPGPELATIDAAAVRQKLRNAFDCLPIAKLLIGWDLPEQLEDVCAEEAQAAGVKLYRWQPLLTGDGALKPPPEWGTVGLQGEPVPGFQNMPEFTFICPNHPDAANAILENLRRIIRTGRYDGIFLDRIRFPSPAADPSRWLACTCVQCRRVAHANGGDLAAWARRITGVLRHPAQLAPVLAVLLGRPSAAGDNAAFSALATFLDFRTHSITAFAQRAAGLIHSQGLSVGLDCFSPALTRMVGQELTALDHVADWIKPMTYCHTLGPAGLPFELLQLADWLMGQHTVSEAQALDWLSLASGLPLPSTRDELRRHGLPPDALNSEIVRARSAGVKTLLAGVELVEIPGVAELDLVQIEADQQALRQSGVDGLVLSWDLWHMPQERLPVVASVWQDAA